MLNNAEILGALYRIAPLELAESWDNPGLILDTGKSAARILTALDLTHNAIDEALRENCGAIVCHHPAIFRGILRIKSDDPLLAAAMAGISVFAAHTNFDAARGGVNDVLAEVIGLTETTEFEALGRIGDLPDALSPTAFAQTVCRALGIGAAQLVNGGHPVRRIAVVGGSAGDLIEKASDMGADAILTGECRHHEALLAIRRGFTVVAAGHFETEKPAVAALTRALQQELGDAAVCIECRSESSPLSTVTLKGDS